MFDLVYKVICIRDPVKFGLPNFQSKIFKMASSGKRKKKKNHQILLEKKTRLQQSVRFNTLQNKIYGNYDD